LTLLVQDNLTGLHQVKKTPRQEKIIRTCFTSVHTEKSLLSGGFPSTDIQGVTNSRH